MSEINIEEALAGTSWMQGFLDGKEDGFEIGLKIGLNVAVQELERLIKKSQECTKDQSKEVEMAEQLRDLERRLAQLGFVRADSHPEDQSVSTEKKEITSHAIHP